MSKKTKLILMPEKDHPVVHLDFALTHGSLWDPRGKEGLASITLSMLLRGTKKKSSEEFHRHLDNLGAEIYLGKTRESLRIYSSVLKDNLFPMLDLIEEMLVYPSFDEAEFAKVKELMRTGLLDELGSDEDIADRRFQEYLLWGNEYGKMTSGSLTSIQSISLEDVRTYHAKYFNQADFVVGLAGGFDRKKVKDRLFQLLKHLPAAEEEKINVPAPVVPKGKSLLVLDKAGRNQSQIYIAAPGVHYSNKDYFGLLLANHVFGGGSFSARLMLEVREKRGWSYGAYSWYRSGKKPLYFAMQTVPSNKDTIPALKLMLKLYSDFAKKGITKSEFDFAKKSLFNQSAFLQDTIRKRLDNKVTEAVIGLPDDFYDKYRQRIKALTYAKVQKAIKKNIDPTRMFCLVLGTYSDLEKDIRTLKGFKNIWKVPFDQAPQSTTQLKPIIF